MKDKRHDCIDMSKPPEPYLPAINSHSGLFKNRNIRFWGTWFAERFITVVKQLQSIAPAVRRQQFTKALTKQLVFALSEGLDVEIQEIKAVKLSLTKNNQALDRETLDAFTERWEDMGGVRCGDSVYRLKPERFVA